MPLSSRLGREWFGNIRGDILSGLVVALALIPEAIAFSIIAGVDPKVGLYASFSMAVTIAFFGGRPAMISAATGAMALLMVGMVKEHGLQYLFLTTIATGVFQLLIGALKLGSLMRFVSRSVVTGFVNALAILIFMAQLPELIGVSWLVYPMTAAGLAIIYLFPRLTRAIPSPLVAIIVLTIVAVVFHMDIHRVGDMGALPDSLPHFLVPDVPWTWETAKIVLPTAAAELFDFADEDIGTIHLDVSGAHFWDLTAVGALDKVVLKFRRAGKTVAVIGLNSASAELVGRLGTHHREGAEVATHAH
ncbi:SulP family inorganic anion transporter [Luteibacter sp. NPDC031894]|uniref:SulP family inorganic anion transporter n=1 Tax=Luteibacter sp. NPDC031894 TaxID=3390572 RepID=UPI003D03E74E